MVLNCCIETLHATVPDSGTMHRGGQEFHGTVDATVKTTSRHPALLQISGLSVILAPCCPEAVAWRDCYPCKKAAHKQTLGGN